MMSPLVRRGTTCSMKHRTRSWIALGLAVAVFTSIGCENRYRAADMERIAQQAASNRSAAATAIVSAVKAGDAEWSSFVDLAFEKLEASWPQDTAQPTNMQQALDAAMFTGAVLDAGKELESATDGSDRLIGGTSGEYELRWFRAGQLAARSASSAYRAGKADEALTLVLAGPSRWQNDAYWLRHPEHDALASMLLAQAGEREEAIRRLQSRSQLNPPADEVLKTLSGR